MKLNRPNKFNKTRHSNQEGTKTALAFWKFPKNRYRTEKHPVIISKVKCSSKSDLGVWGKDDSNNLRKVDVHSGKSITWYSFRHSYITMRLKAGVPVPVIAANTDTSMKYIQNHYFHYRADESTEILGKGRNIRPAEENLRWIGSV